MPGMLQLNVASQETEPKYIGDFIEPQDWEIEVSKLPLRERLREYTRRAREDSIRDHALLKKSEDILKELSASQPVIHSSED